jgi:hypothetical protein
MWSRPIYALTTESVINYRGLIPYSYSILDELNRLSRIFVIINVEISIIVRPSLSRLGKLEIDSYWDKSVFGRFSDRERGLIKTVDTKPINGRIVKI